MVGTLKRCFAIIIGVLLLTGTLYSSVALAEEASDNEYSEAISEEEDSSEEVDESSDSDPQMEEVEDEESSAPSVTYTTHVQTYGWLDAVSDGETSGTTGLSKRMEAIQIVIENTDLEGSVEYSVHCQTYGWMDWVSDGETAGTTGLAKRMEAIKIQLTGELAEYYDIYYRVHVQTLGWLDWACNGDIAGTTGLYKRVEAIEIVLVEKGGTAPGETETAYASVPSVEYTTHVQTYGWQSTVSDGDTAGTTGLSKRMEAIQIELTDYEGLTGSITYRVHCQTYGWMDWVSDGETAGTTGEAKRMEAIQIKLTDDLASVCDVYYRVHVQSYGWLAWTKNGATAGTTGLGLRIEAIEIVIVPKSSSTTISTSGTAYYKYTSAGYYTIGSNSYYYSSSGTRANGWVTISGNKYYFTDGVKTTGWKYIDGYKYYFKSNGVLVQDVDSIIGTQSSYVIKVNKTLNCVTIYASDGASYCIPVKSMLCSTGDDTPVGTITTLAKYRWREMYNGTYVQYATRLTPSPGVLFHSIPYTTKGDIYSMDTAGYNGLGVTKSSGCIRLTCGDAYWIYTNCAIGTTVIIYEDSSSPGPFDVPTLTKIPSTQTWDPTDPNI